MDNSNVNIDLIRGHVDTIILKSLYYEDKYGYEILNEIKEKSKGMYTLKQPTLYSCLKRLEKQGYIRSYKGDTSNGAQRVYYSLQPAGRAFLESDQHQWEFSRTIIDSLLSDEEFDPERQVAPFDPSNFRPLTRRNKPGVDSDLDNQDEERENVSASSVQPSDHYVYDDGFSLRPDEYSVPPETQAPPVDEYDEIGNGYVVEYVCPPDQRAFDSATENAPAQSDSVVSDIASETVASQENVGGTQSETSDRVSGNPSDASSTTVADENYGVDRVEEYDAAQDAEPVYDDVSEDNSDNVTTSTQQAGPSPVFYGEDRVDAVQPQEEMRESTQTPADSGRPTDVSAPEAAQTQQQPAGNYTSYVSDSPATAQDSAAREESRDALYERREPQPAQEVRTYNTDVSQDAAYDDYSSRQTVNYIDSFDSIYNVPMTQVSPSHAAVASAQDDEERIDYLSTSELKSKMMSEGYNLRPYVKKNTSEYYINQYYFSNRLNRDSSILTYIVYAIGVLIAYFSTAPKYGQNLPGLFGFLALGLLYPVAMFISYCVDPKKRIKANFRAKNALINSLIVMINAVILIVLIGFLAFGARIDNFDSMVRPVIIPLVFLLMIPIAIAIYYRLYKSNHYHVN